MIDFANLENYVENNRIEAKKAQGGLPKSIWETYSAFANTLGGVILLGVEETADKSLAPVKIDNPQALVDEFWQLVNDERVASANILTAESVKIIGVHGEKIIAIEVPKAERVDKPVYVGGNIYTGTYRRNGEGDYRCTRASVDAMRQDSFLYDKDMKMLVWSSIDDIYGESVLNFLNECSTHRGGNAANDDIENAEFLIDIGAVVADEDGKVHLTAAGLLMFGKKDSIVKEYPYFSLSYSEDINGKIYSICGENIYHFYSLVCERIENLELFQFFDEKIKFAICEALANSMLHADYYVHGGVNISVCDKKMEFSNPGTLRIDADNAFVQGVFDPRNGALINIFKKIKPGSGKGQGLHRIKHVFSANNLNMPVFKEEFEPERTILVFDFCPKSINLRQDKTSTQEFGLVMQKIKELYYRDEIIDYITAKSECSFDELCELIDGDTKLTKLLLDDLEMKCLITQNGVYKLKI